MITRKKIAVFTAIFGGYDALIPPKHYSSLAQDADFFCFTDNAGMYSDHFSIIVVDRIHKDPQRSARYYKVKGYEQYLHEYEYCLWIDSNSELVLESFAQLLANYGQFDVSVYIHSDRNCIYKEARWVTSANRDNPWSVNNQIKYMRKQGFPANYGLAATNLLLRKNNEVVSSLNEKWWNLIARGTKRDQLSFDFVRWQLKDALKFSYIYVIWNNNHYTITHDHQKAYQSRHIYTTTDRLNELRFNLKKKTKGLLTKIKRKLVGGKSGGNSASRPTMQLSRFQEADVPFQQSTIKIVDIASFNFIMNEIFDKEIYKFLTEKHTPYILDCGANIGLSIIYFKQLYPTAEIVGFEPDEKIFNVLSDNIKRLGYSNVELVKKACWNEETTLTFYSEGADGGRAAHDMDKDKLVNVETVRLRKYINKQVDFLKIDIEGAEFEVLQDIADLLINVQHIFVEYHSFLCKEQKLADILNILKNAGFRLHVTSPGLSSNNPFMKVKTYANMDNQLNIYGFRNASN